MSENQKTYEFLYNNYKWPEPGAERNCPYSGEPLHLTKQDPSYNGKPWTCPKCIYYFSEEELASWDSSKHKDCENATAHKGT